MGMDLMMHVELVMNRIERNIVHGIEHGAPLESVMEEYAECWVC